MNTVVTIVIVVIVIVFAVRYALFVSRAKSEARDITEIIHAIENVLRSLENGAIK